MPSGERYALQRADLQWYAGTEGAEAQWVPRLRQAFKLNDFDEAKELQATLQQKGHRVFVMEV